MNFNNIFNRWSFNSLSFFLISSILCFHIGGLTIQYLSNGNDFTGGALFLFFCFLAFQAFALMTSCIILVKEHFSTDFRIKNKTLLKICDNIFYRSFAVIFSIIEVILMLTSTYLFFKILPEFI